MAVIDDVINLGDDQITNQFELVFPTGVPGVTVPGIETALALRMDQTMDEPQRAVGTYEFKYQGIKIIKRNYDEETDKRFTLSFRLDQNWEIDDALEQWFNISYNENDGTGAPEADASTTLQVKAFGPNKEHKKTMQWTGVRIINKKPTPWDHNTGEATHIECEFIYHKYSRITPTVT